MAEQNYLSDEMKPPSFEDVEKAANDYRETRDSWMKMGKTAEELKATLLEVMRGHEIATYSYDGYDVVISEEVNVKVNKHKDGKKDK